MQGRAHGRRGRRRGAVGCDGVTVKRGSRARETAENWRPGLRGEARPGRAVPGMTAAKRGRSGFVLDRPAPLGSMRIEPDVTKAHPRGAKVRRNSPWHTH